MAKHGYHLLLLLIILFFFTVGCYSGFTKEQTQEDIAQSNLQMINRKLKQTRFLHVDDRDKEGSSDNRDKEGSSDNGYDGDKEGSSDSNSDSDKEGSNDIPSDKEGSSDSASDSGYDGDNDSTSYISSDDGTSYSSASSSYVTSDRSNNKDDTTDVTSDNSNNDGTSDGTSDSEGESVYSQHYGRLHDLIYYYDSNLELLKQLCEDAPCYEKDDTACYTSKVASLPSHQCSPCDLDAHKCTYRQPTRDLGAELESYLHSLQIYA